MPLYDRSCNACGEVFEVQCKISEKDDMRSCPKCSSTDGVWRIGTPFTSTRPERLMTHRADNGFKEVLQKIGERNKRTEIAKR